jgi:hypothetical protein
MAERALAQIVGTASRFIEPVPVAQCVFDRGANKEDVVERRRRCAAEAA